MNKCICVFVCTCNVKDQSEIRKILNCYAQLVPAIIDKGPVYNMYQYIPQEWYISLTIVPLQASIEQLLKSVPVSIAYGHSHSDYHYKGCRDNGLKQAEGCMVHDPYSHTMAVWVGSVYASIVGSQGSWGFSNAGLITPGGRVEEGGGRQRGNGRGKVVV